MIHHWKLSTLLQLSSIAEGDKDTSQLCMGLFTLYHCINWIAYIATQLKSSTQNKIAVVLDSVYFLRLLARKTE